MKKIMLVSICFLAISAFAQKEKDSTNVESNIYVPLGAQFQSNLNINSKLALSNLPSVPETMPEVGFGINILGKKYSGNLEFTGVWSEISRNSNRSVYALTNIRGNFSFNLMNKPKTVFATGLNIAYASTSFAIYNENTVVDLNNLNPSSNSGRISLANRRLFVGPAATLYLFRTYKYPVRLQAAYEFGLTPGTWSSDFANVANTVNEIGRNRFMFSIALF